MYDGHNRTFFFADYTGIKERRGVTTVNTVPTAQARLGDFSNYRDRNGNLIVDLRPGDDARRSRPGTIIRDPFPGTSSRPTGSTRSARTSRASTRCQTRVGQLRQLHLDAGSRDHGQRVLGARRSQDLGQRLVLRAVQLRQVQARRPAGPGELLSADAARRGGPVRSRAVRRRHPEHAPDDARRRVQLLEGDQVEPDQRAARRLRQDGAVHDAVGLRASRGAVARHQRASTSTTSRRGCRTSTSRISPAFRADRSSCPSTRSSSTTRSRTRWCGCAAGTS